MKKKQEGNEPGDTPAEATDGRTADERAEELASSMGLGLIRLRQGRPSPLPSPEEAAAHRYTPDELDQLRRYRRAQVLGDPGRVREELGELVERTAADEVMVMTSVHDHAARLRSYELLAEAFAAVPTSGPPAGARAAGG